MSCISVFLLFLYLNMKHNKTINVLGASTYGVLLIHANSDAMRQWLWKDLLDNVGVAYLVGRWLPLHALGSVFCIFIVCVGLDRIRVRVFEKPFLKWVDCKQVSWKNSFNRFEKKVFNKLHING